MESSSIKYPSPPPDGYKYGYVDIANPFMLAALKIAHSASLDTAMPTGAVVVNTHREIVSQAANGSDYHKTHICERVRLNIPTGQGYELCEGCHPKNHAEHRAVTQTSIPANCDIYLWGHWWCCDDCFVSIVAAKIAHVYLLTDSEILFNKSHPKNIVGHQFEYFSNYLK